MQYKTNMEYWWHKMRKAWFSVSSGVKFRKSAGSRGGKGCAACGSVSGLLKLQDDVQMCGYKDVEVMWNMFIESNPEQMAAAAAAAAIVTSTPKPRKQNQRPSCRSLFWSHNTTTTTASFTSFNQVLITTADEKYRNST